MEASDSGSIREMFRSENKIRRNVDRNKNVCDKRNIDPKEEVDKLGRVLSQEEIKTICENLKKKSSININDLALLKLSFIQNCDNISLFFGIEGALSSLVTLLIGTNSIYQIAAADCLCNLSLDISNLKGCIQIAKAAGIYLISYLQGLHYNLMNSCLLALGNLAASDTQCWEILRSQGLLNSLLHLLKLRPPTVIENALYAIVQFLKVGLYHLGYEELQKLSAEIINEFFQNPSPNCCTALYLISCSESCESLLLEKNVVHHCLNIIEDCVVNADSVKSITSLIRTIANIIPERSGTVVVYLTFHWTRLSKIVECLLNSSYSHFKPELAWLIGNILNHSSGKGLESNCYKLFSLF
uniref:IBB domain-containing protein n=1 Tax=Clastoptera arizonana TaxID=38151 RepID=A0A1B6C518_9HEMI